MTDNIDLKNPLAEQTDIFAQPKIEPLAVANKVVNGTSKSKSKMMIILAIVFIAISVVFCCCSLSSYYYAQSGPCKKVDATSEQKNQCNMIGSPSSISSSLSSLLIMVGLGLGIFNFIKKDN